MDGVPKLSVVRGNNTYIQPRQIHRLFEENMVKYSDKLSIIVDGSDNNSALNISYHELNSESNKIARFIINTKQKKNLQPNIDGDYLVAVCISPSDKLIKTLLAIWKAGAAYLPIDLTFPRDRIHQIANESKPIIFIVENQVIKEKMPSNMNTFTLTEIYEEISNNEDRNVFTPNMIINSDLAIVQYTSGSTGIPKGVRLTHSMICNRIFWQWKEFPYTDKEKVGIFKTALTFVDSISEIWSPLLTGKTILIIPKKSVQNPEELVFFLEKYSIVRLVLVPTLLRNIIMFLKLNKTKRFLKDLKYWICSGEPLPMKLAMDFYNYFDEKDHNLLNFYGSTEVMGDVTFYKCRESMEHMSIPIGKPIDNTIIYLLDDSFRPVKVCEVGEIFIAGSNLAKGYVNKRDAHRFIENPYATNKAYNMLYRTGDYGSFEKGEIFYRGRTDTQIKIRGHRVDLSEIEKALQSLAEIEKVVVLSHHQGELDQLILAFVKPSNSENISKQYILDSLQSKLQSYMIPQLIIVEEFPVLVNGKVDRQKLLSNFMPINNNNEGDFVVDLDFKGVPDNYKEMCADLYEVIQSSITSFNRCLSLKSNFYEIGGNSLNSIYTITLLREKGYFIGISDFITSKSLGEILFKLKKNKNDSISMEDWKSSCPHLDIVSIPLDYDHKNIIKIIITDSFYGKAELERLLKPDIYPQDYCDVIDDIWEVLVQKDLSFIVKDKNSNEIIGVSLNFDARDEPEVEIKSKLSIIFDFLEYVEGSVRDSQLPTGINSIFHAFMMGTSKNLTAQENIACIQFMEYEVLKLATRKKFAGILTTNTSPLTKQMGTEVFNYDSLLEYPINRYTHRDGTKPFKKADDTETVIVAWKSIPVEK